MASFAKTETPDTSCKGLLEQSITNYQEIETLYQSMQDNLSAFSVLKVMQTLATLNSLQQEAQKVDNLIAERFRAVSSMSEYSDDLDALLGKREKILTKLYQDNRKISDRAENVKSLLRHEISSISTSHKAIKGYKPAGKESRSLIRDAF